jgi:hypothetical protein
MGSRATTPALPERLRRPLLVGAAIVSLLGLAVELLASRAPDDDLTGFLAELFSLSYEQNVPTWYASSLLLGCALLLAAIAGDARDRRLRHRHRWLILSIGFFVMSIDETAELHEMLGQLYAGTGVLHFGWVVPAAGIVAGVVALMWPLVADLEVEHRRRFLLAAALYLGGAVAMELPLGWWAEHHGEHGLGYALIDWIEETLELAGASVFVHALARRWHQREVATA